MTKFKKTLLSELKYYCFYIWWNRVKIIPFYIESFFQRGLRGWADCDTWEFDLYLAKVISQGVKHLKKYDNGIPSNIYNKYKDRKDLTQKQKDALAIKEWKAILNNIIDGFESMPKLFEVKLLNNEKLRNKHMDKLDLAFGLLKKHYFDLWD